MSENNRDFLGSLEDEGNFFFRGKPRFKFRVGLAFGSDFVGVYLTAGRTYRFGFSTDV